MADFELVVGASIQPSIHQFKTDLGEIVKELDKDPVRVKVGIDTDSKAIGDLSSQLSKMVGKIDLSKLDLSKINKAATATKEVAKEAAKTKTEIKEVAKATKEISTFDALRKTLDQKQSGLAQRIRHLNTITSKTKEGTEALKQLNATFDAIEISKGKLAASNTVVKEDSIVGLINQIQELDRSVDIVRNKMLDVDPTPIIKVAKSVARANKEIAKESSDMDSGDPDSRVQGGKIYEAKRSGTKIGSQYANLMELTKQGGLSVELQKEVAKAQDSVEKWKTAMLEMQDAGEDASDELIADFKKLQNTTGETVDSAFSKVKSFYDSKSEKAAGDKNGIKAKVAEIIKSVPKVDAEYSKLVSALQSMGGQEAKIEEIRELYLKHSENLSRARQGTVSDSELANLRAEREALRARIQELEKGTPIEADREAKNIARANKALEKQSNILDKIQKVSRWTASRNGKTSGSYENIVRMKSKVDDLSNSFKSGSISVDKYEEELAELQRQLGVESRVIRDAGEDHKSFGEKIKNIAERLTAWFSVSNIIMGSIRTVKEMTNAVIELDTAMTELRKVTDEPESEYSAFLDRAGDRAKVIGASIKDTVNATADFARLGYGLRDAEKLADAAIVYKNVGDGLKDINEASESVIATMQAYGVEASNAMSIIDKFNAVGNNYAISSSGVGEALLKSAAAMKAANNTLDETIALATAANTIVQDPQKVGTTLKTVSMYLRAAKTEMEESGESTEGMATSVSKLRNEILALTGNKVDIQIDDNTFKSTYQILKEMSEVWHELSDVTQANILERLGGKRNSNVVAAILDNFNVASSALETSIDSQGSALAENEKYLDSVQGHLTVMRSSFEDLSKSIVQSDMLKTIIDWGTGLIDATNAVSSFVGGLWRINKVLLSIAATNAVIFGYVKLRSLDKVDKLFNSLRAIKDVLSSIKALELIDGTKGLMTNLSDVPNKLEGAFKKAGLSISASTIKLAAFSTAVGAVIGVVSIMSREFDKAREKEKETYNAAIDKSKSAAKDYEKVNSLIREYSSLYEKTEGKWDSSQIERIRDIQEELVSLGGDEAEGLDLINSGLKENYKILEATAEKYAEISYNAANVAAMQTQNKIDQGYKADRNFWGVAQDDGFNGSGRYIIGAVNHSLIKNGGTFDGKSSFQFADINEYLENYAGDYEQALSKVTELRDLAQQAINDPSFKENLNVLPWEDKEEIFGKYIQGVEYLNSKVNELTASIEASREAKKRLYAADADKMVLRDSKEIYSQADFDKWVENLLSSDKPQEYIQTAMEKMSSMLPGYILSDESKKLIIADTEKLTNEIGAHIADSKGSFDKKAVSNLLAGMDSSEYKDFINWWDKNKHLETFPATLDEITKAFAQHRKEVKEASLTLEDYINNYNQINNNAGKSQEDVTDAYNKMMNAYVREISGGIGALWKSDDFAKTKAELIEIAKTIGKISPKKIKDLTNENKELGRILDLNGMSAEFLANILTHMGQGYNGLALVTPEMLELNEVLEGMSDEFEKVADSKKKYDEAMSVPEKDTDFKSMAEAFKTLNDEFTKGTVNSNAFWASAEFLFGEEQLDSWGWSDGVDKIYDAMKKNVNIFKEADSAGYGFLERMKAISKNGKIFDSSGNIIASITKGKNGEDILDIDQKNIKELAKAMNLSEEATLSCLEALEMFSDLRLYNINEVADKIKEVGLSVEIADRQAVNVDDLTGRLQELGKSKKYIKDLLSELKEVDGITFLSAKAETKDLIASLKDLKLYNKGDKGQVVDSGGLISLMQDLNFTKEQAEELFTKLNDVEGLVFTEKGLSVDDSNVVSLKDVLDTIANSDFTTTESELEKISGSAQNISDAILGIDGKSITVRIDILGSILGDNADIVRAVFGSTPFSLPKGNSGKNIQKDAKGTNNAAAGIALVGEEGEELVQSGNNAYFVGSHGAEITRLRRGDKVYTAQETKRIKNGLSPDTNFPAFSGGGVYGGISKNKYPSLLPDDKKSKHGSSKSKSSSSSKKAESEFERLYRKHQHLLAMDAENVSDYLNWLQYAYKKAYEKGEIELNDYYKYQEEVYKGYKDLFKDSLADIEHEISMRENYEGESRKILSLYKGLMSSVQREIASARAEGLDDTDDYIQELQNKWQDYANAIKEIQESAKSDAKDAVGELIDYRIEMIKQEADKEKEAIDKRLDHLRDFYDKQKEMLQDQYDEEKYLEEQKEKRKSVSDLQSELEMLSMDDSAWAQKRKLELQQEISDAKKDLGDFEDEHALDNALDLLDKQYESQEKNLEKELEALENKINDPEALYNQALNDIRNNTGGLYREMIEYNRRHGTGNDEDVKDMYEEAYKTLLEYKRVYGEDYKGIVMPNSTGYVPETGSWDKEVISGTNPANKPKPKPKPKPAPSSGSSSKPSLKKGTSVTIKKSATNFGSKSNGVHMARGVAGGKYTVYDYRDGQVLIGRNGVYTGWVKRSDIVGYAHGTMNATRGLHRIDELGSEYLFTSRDGNKYRVLNDGDKVLNAKASEFLYNFASSGGKILGEFINNLLGGNSLSGIQPIVINNDVTMGNIIVQGNADEQTVSAIRRAERDSISNMLKSLNRLNR